MGDQSEPMEGVAVAVGVDADGPLAGALILGASGTGKSRTALELIETCPWHRSALIADDVMLLKIKHGSLIASAPKAVQGLLEIRGFGPSPVKSLSSVELVGGFDLDSFARRLPEPAMRRVLGHNLPIWPFVAGEGAAHRIRTMLRTILAGQTP